MKSIRAADVFVALGLAAIFAAGNVIASLRQGVLAAPPTYDEITYFVDGAQRLQILYDNDILALVRSFVSDPPHAPVSTLVSMLGFGLFGMHPWAVPVVNGIWVFLILLGLRLFLVAQPLPVYFAAAAAVLAWPLMAFLLMVGQADVVCGLFTAAGCLYILSSPWTQAPRHHVLIAGLFAGLALLAKPSISPVTLFLFGSAALLASVVDYAARFSKPFSLRGFIGANLLFLSATILVALPYYAFGWKSTVDYISDALFGVNRGAWMPKLTPMQQAAYYLWGPGGETMMGPWLVITALFLILAAILQHKWLVSHRARVTAIATWGVGAYLVVTVPATKSVFLGIVVSCTIFLFFIAALSAILAKITAFGSQNPGQLSIALKACLSAALLMIAAITFHWHVYYRSSGSPRVENPAIAAKRFVLIDHIVDETTVPFQSTRIYLPAISQYMNKSILQFAILQHNILDTTVVELPFDDNIADHLAALATATHVILLDPDDPEMYSWLSSASILREIAKKVANDPDLKLKKIFETADGQHHIALYERRGLSPFGGVRFVSGFLPAEGPYPQWKLSYVRWATGTEAHLEPTSNKHGSLYLKARSSVADQSISVNVDGHSVGVCHLPVAGVTGECEIAFPQDLQTREVTLRFSRHGLQNQGNRTVLFQKIQMK